MKLCIVIFVTLFVASANSLSLVACGDNEVFSDCGCNDITCEDQFKVCPIVCRSGCYCAPGFVRSAENLCVPQTECPQITTMTCKKNEIYNACGALSSEPSCDNPIILAPATDMKMERPVCESGCYCKLGFFRNSKGNCIRQENCMKTQCPEKEVYTSCGSGCGELTCDKPTFGDMKCPAVCRVGCTCKPGFVRNKEGSCIREKNCPRNKCNKNTEIYQCGLKMCQEICDKPINEICTYSKFRCMDDCFCKPGYIRASIDGPCIPVQKCNRLSSQNCNAATEKYVMGVKPCENICGTGVDPACAYTTYMPMKACFCKDGYIRESKSGNCIPVEQCPQSKCNIDTEVFKCGVKQCEFICGIGVDEFCSRARFMCKDGCFCKQDYVRDVNGNCIPETDCAPIKPSKPIVEIVPIAEPTPILPSKPIVPIAEPILPSKPIVNIVPIAEPAPILPSTMPTKQQCNIDTEVFKCGVKQCEFICGIGVDEFCSRARFMCNDGCFCKQGFVRNVNGKCIPETDCAPIKPSKPIVKIVPISEPTPILISKPIVAEAIPIAEAMPIASKPMIKRVQPILLVAEKM